MNNRYVNQFTKLMNVKKTNEIINHHRAINAQLPGEPIKESIM